MDHNKKSLENTSEGSFHPSSSSQMIDPEVLLQQQQYCYSSSSYHPFMATPSSSTNEFNSYRPLFGSVLLNQVQPLQEPNPSPSELNGDFCASRLLSALGVKNTSSHENMEGRQNNIAGGTTKASKPQLFEPGSLFTWGDPKLKEPLHENYYKSCKEVTSRLGR